MLDAVGANMFEVIDDLFFAATGTISTTLRWGLLFLILHPEIQTNCRLEISQVCINTKDLNIKNPVPGWGKLLEEDYGVVLFVLGVRGEFGISTWLIFVFFAFHISPRVILVPWRCVFF